MSALLALPPELTIYAVGDLCAQWRAALADPSTAAGDDPVCRLDGANVEAVDAAGLQLVVALANQLAARQQSLRIERPSRLLADACTMLGLGALIESKEGAPA